MDQGTCSSQEQLPAQYRRTQTIQTLKRAY